MRTRYLWLITLVAAALTTGLAFAHAMELPPKVGYDFALYRDLQHSLYAFFALVGGPLEVLAVISGIVLAITTRHTPDRRWTLAGAVLLAAGLATWAAVVQTANVAMGGWPATPPAGWESVRLQWELGHVAHFTVFGAGFVVLVLALVRRTALPVRRRSATQQPSA